MFEGKDLCLSVENHTTTGLPTTLSSCTNPEKR